jgi:hypothetical protein
VVQRYAEWLQPQGGMGGVLFVDLGSFSSEQRLFEDVLRSDQVQEWVRGDHALHLFLDGLDEGLRLIPSLAKTLTQSCGTGPWIGCGWRSPAGAPTGRPHSKPGSGH